MLNRAFLILALCALGTPALAGPAHAQTSRAKAASRATVQSVFVPANLGIDLEQLEAKIGPAQNVSGPIHSYTLQGCHLEVLADEDDGEAISALGVDLTSPRCAVDLAPFLLQDDPIPVAGRTLGQFQAAHGGEYRADCLVDCVTALDPRIYLYYQGFLANHHVDIRLSSIDSGVGRTTWGGPLAQEHGIGYVKKTAFNCDPQGQAHTNGVASMAITRVDVGYDLDPGHCVHDEH